MFRGVKNLISNDDVDDDASSTGNHFSGLETTVKQFSIMGFQEIKRFPFYFERQEKRSESCFGSSRKSNQQKNQTTLMANKNHPTQRIGNWQGKTSEHTAHTTQASRTNQQIVCYFPISLVLKPRIENEEQQEDEDRGKNSRSSA